MPNVVVYFNNCIKDGNKEKLSQIIVNKTSMYLSLPELVEVEYKKLYNNLYGETLLYSGTVNRIRINVDLPLREIIFPITHELIHLSQIHEGRLTFKRDNVIVWNRQEYRIKDPYSMSYEEQQNLPWESDVVKKQQYILAHLLNN